MRLRRTVALRAAFVAITVAGQQGNFPPKPFPVPISDFRFWILDLKPLSKIGNPKLGEEGGGNHPFPLNPPAAYKIFV